MRVVPVKLAGDDIVAIRIWIDAEQFAVEDYLYDNTGPLAYTSSLKLPCGVKLELRLSEVDL